MLLITEVGKWDGGGGYGICDCATSYLKRSVSCDTGGGRHEAREVIKKMSSWLKRKH